MRISRKAKSGGVPSLAVPFIKDDFIPAKEKDEYLLQSTGNSKTERENMLQHSHIKTRARLYRVCDLGANERGSLNIPHP